MTPHHRQTIYVARISTLLSPNVAVTFTLRTRFNPENQLLSTLESLKDRQQHAIISFVKVVLFIAN